MTDKYKSAAKSNYRNDVWAAITNGWDRYFPSIANALILCGPSPELEIGLLLALGFKENHIFAVDINAAFVAKARQAYPNINTYPCSLTEAVQRMEDMGVIIDCANLDFCGTVALGVLPEFRSVVVNQKVFPQNVRLAVTYLCARDQPGITQFLMEEFSACDRIGLLHEFMCSYRPWTVYLQSKRYRSGKAAMEWAVFNG